jgi:hypothetical protein
MTNYVPRTQTLVLKGFKNGTSEERIVTFCKELTPYLVSYKVKKDIKPLNSKYKFMAFLNYSSEEQALLAKDKAISDIKLLKAKGHWMDISHVTVVLAIDLKTQACQQPFALWIGNIDGASDAALIQAFSQYGLLATDAVVAKSTGAGQRYAFVNFSGYQGANAARQACDQGKIVVGAASLPVIACACASVALVDAVLASLRRSGPAALRFAEAARIADDVERTAKPTARMDGWLELLRRLPHLLAVDDVAETIALAQAPVAVQPAGSVLRAPSLPRKASAGRTSGPALLPFPIGPPPLGRATAAAGEAAAAGVAVTAGVAAAAGVAAVAGVGVWECSVCFRAETGKAALVPCGHTFCRGCCAGLFQMGTCPKCRALATHMLLLYDA